MTDLEAPEIVVDEEASTFKRTVALLVVLITLFGSIVAYLQSRESNDEDVAARDAQRDAIAGLGAQVDASAAFTADLRIGSEVDIQLQREALNAARVNNLAGDGSAGDPEADLHRAAAQRFAVVREAIAGLTPIDPSNPITIDADFAAGNESADAARLRQSVEADLANDHGGKADSYVAVLTVLAVALFLLGLSLTVQGRSRLVLAAPGVAIAVVCVGWTALISGRDVTQVSERAIQSAAEGQRLLDAPNVEGALDAAIAAFDEAIEDSPDFAAAYARRADARFLEGVSQIGQTTFLSITSDEALEAALADLDDALALGADDDVNTVASAGFFEFLAGDFARSQELSRQALDLNDQLAPVWFNLGVAQVAEGDELAAERSYREGRQLLDDVPDAGTRAAVLAGARTDLSVLREILHRGELEDVIDLIEATEIELAAFEAGLIEVPCPTEPCPAPEAVDGNASVGEGDFTPSGAFVFANFPVEGAEPGTPITNVWYVRTDDDVPFEQAAISLEVIRVGDDGRVSTATLASVSPACPVAGEYLVRAYAGERFLGEVLGTIEPGPFGAAFSSEVDPVEGFEACVPEGFTVDRADLTELDAFTTFAGPDLVVGLNATPGALAEGIDGVQLQRAVLAEVLGIEESELVEVTLQGRDLSGNFVALPAAAGASRDGDTVSALSIGPDGAARNITITGTGDLALLDEAVRLIQFTGLPEG